MIGRVIGTVGAFFAYGSVYTVYNSFATLITSKVAGDQFQNSDVSAITVPLTFNVVQGVGGLCSLALVVVLIAIWYRPIIKLIADATEYDRNNY